MYLYTKPHILSQVMPVPKFFISIDPEDDLQKFCADINVISGTILLNEHKLSNKHFSDVESRILSFSIDNQIWSMIPKLTKLHSLILYDNWNIACSQLKTSFDEASHLFQLAVYIDEQLASKTLSLKHINRDFEFQKIPKNPKI